MLTKLLRHLSVMLADQCLAVPNKIHLEKQLRQAQATKEKLFDDIDSLDPEDRHWEMRKLDLDKRLDRIYDKIEKTESQLIDAKAKKQTIEEEKMTGDNIYRVLQCFGKLYEVMNDEERRDLMQAMISEIHIHQQPQPNGQWLKSIRFRLPIIGEDIADYLDIETGIENVVSMVKAE